MEVEEVVVSCLCVPVGLRLPEIDMENQRVALLKVRLMWIKKSFPRDKFRRIKKKEKKRDCMISVMCLI